MDYTPSDSFLHEISQQEYWSGLPFPSPGNLPYPRIKLTSLAYPALAGLVLAPRPPDERESPRRFGKDSEELAPGAWDAQVLGGRVGERDLSGVWRQGVGRRWRVPKFSV